MRTAGWVQGSRPVAHSWYVSQPACWSRTSSTQSVPGQPDVAPDSMARHHSPGSRARRTASVSVRAPGYQTVLFRSVFTGTQWTAPFSSGTHMGS
ncbi:hypothetical protein LUX05_13790 [Streptomyces somaliensis]|nr:hypothetical protein [Streptomyces somaliensis]